MRKRLRPVPVLFACRGCARDAVAREVVAALDREGVGEGYAAGAEAARAQARFPVYAIEGCAEACAARWLASVGARPTRTFILKTEANASEEAVRIADLAS